MTQEKAWWELKPLQLKHYKTASGARKYAQRTPGRWYIATSFDRCFHQRGREGRFGRLGGRLGHTIRSVQSRRHGRRSDVRRAGNR